MNEEDVTGNTNETTANVAKIYNCLLQHEPINFFAFFINPNSFSESVENLFHLSFLIRDGKVVVEDNEDGIPVLETADPPTAEDFEQGASKKQSVFHFDFRTFKVMFCINHVRILWKSIKFVQMSFPIAAILDLLGLNRNDILYQIHATLWRQEFRSIVLFTRIR